MFSQPQMPIRSFEPGNIFNISEGEIPCGRGQKAMGPNKAMDEKDLSATQDGLAAKIREKNLCAEWCVGA